MTGSTPDSRAGSPGRRHALTTAATALVLLAATSCAEAAPPYAPGSEYVALGSSFAAGPGIEPVADESCFRSRDNYARHVAATLQMTLVDVTCTGATTDNAPVQVESVTAETALVTITLGGNDVGYAISLDDYACLDIGLCTEISVDQEAVESRLGTITDRLVTILGSIRERAPQARVLLVTYPHIVPPAGTTCPDMPLTAEHAEFTRTVGARLDEVFRDAAERSGAGLVDVYAASSERGVCEPDSPWVGGLPPGTAPSGQFPFHPTATGMRATAELIVRALRSG